jgi:hypothetical protein
MIDGAGTGGDPPAPRVVPGRGSLVAEDDETGGKPARAVRFDTARADGLTIRRPREEAINTSSTPSALPGARSGGAA